MRSLLFLLLAACASNPPAADPTPTGPTVHAVTAVIVANKCSGLSQQDVKRAEDTMNKLVERCRAVPHGVRSFGVILLPGGDLQFTGDEDAGEDEVPICVVSHRLSHSVQLKKQCEIDIRLEQSKMGP